MDRSWRSRLLVVLFVIASTHPSIFAQSSDQRIYAQPPLQTELLNALDAGHTKTGSPVITKALYNWSAPGCTLATGATATGIVLASAVDKANKVASLTVRFDTADCNGKLGSPLRMRVFAIIVQPPPSYERAFADQGGLFGSYSERAPAGFGAKGSTPTVHRYDPSSDMTVAVTHEQKLPKVIQAGMVLGEKGVTLEPDGPDGSSIVSKREKSLRLDVGTKLVLMPVLRTSSVERELASRDARSDQATTPTSTPPTPPTVSQNVMPSTPPPDETDVCSNACSVGVGSMQTSTINVQTGSVDGVDLRRFGYGRPDRREFEHFHHAYTVTYLSEDRLLVSFDLHSFRRRETDGLHPDYVHLVRAVEFDPHTRTVIRVVDWQVYGEEQYLWAAGSGHVLVHMGHQLRLLDAELKTVASLELPPVPLVWVALVPGGKTMAAGLLHERHTSELHNKLVELTNVEPEESIDVVFLDRELNILGTSSQPSTVAPPVLSSKGELRVLPLSKNQWELEEFSRDHSERRLAIATSDCQPHLDLATEQTLFLTGCTRGQFWYRALRWDGHTVVRGTPSSQQLEQAAVGDAEGGAFAIRVVWDAISHDGLGRMRPADLQGEDVSVYRADDGKRLFVSRVTDVPLAEQSFALSPQAHQLAILGTDRLYLYPVMP